MRGANSTAAPEDTAGQLAALAAQLATMLRVEVEGDWKAWSELHVKLVEVATAASADDRKTAVETLLKIANDSSSSQALMRTFEERVPNASLDLLKGLALLVADELIMTPLCDCEPIQMVDEEWNFCIGSVERIINCSAELSAPNAPYAVVSIMGPQSSGKSYLLNCLFGTKFPVMNHKLGWMKTTRGVMMSRCIKPSLLLLDIEGFHGEGGEGQSFEEQVTFFLLTVSDLVIINVSVYDLGREQMPATSLFTIIIQERRKLHSEGLTKILVVVRRCDEEESLEMLRIVVLSKFRRIWERVHGKSTKFTDYIEVDIVVLQDKSSPEFPKDVAVLRKMLSNSKNAKVPASSFLLNSKNLWDSAAVKDVAARLATMLKFQGEKGREAWSRLHGKLAEAASAIAGGNTRMAVVALLEVAKDVSAQILLMEFQGKKPLDWIKTFEEGVRNANTDLLKDLVVLIADKWSMSPLCDSEPLEMLDEYHNFNEGNVERIICSAELSAPNAPYSVISIIGGQGSGKSYLLNYLFGTKFPEMDTRNGRIQRGIMISRCIWPSLLLLDFEGFRRTPKGQDLTFHQKQATLFALTVSDIVIVNMQVSDIGLDQAAPTLLFRIIFQEITKLPQGFTKILVVVRFYDGEPPMDTLRSTVQIRLEKIWEGVHVEHPKFKDYIEVNIVGLPRKNSPKFPNEVTLLRKLLSKKTSAKVPASRFSRSSSIHWNNIMQNKELDLHQSYPGESNFPSESRITTVFSSGHVEASSSTHSNNNLSAIEPRAMTFQELQRITDDFSEERLLGSGGFGKVYKGVLDNRKLIRSYSETVDIVVRYKGKVVLVGGQGVFDDGEVVAVKKLHNNPGLVEKGFMNELMNLMIVQHKNIIRLVGYCSETRDKILEYEGKRVLAGQQERALCLEYMEGGTLEKLLSDESCGLDWEACYKLIKGICHGLKHLHTGSKDPIYHLDLKPANILLDKDGIPKIGDFGLSRLLASTGTFVTQTNPGTPRYMPPEYIEWKQISPKFDVYSLGVIMIEVIAGRDNYYKSADMPSQTFIELVTANWSKRVEPKAMSSEQLLQVQRFLKIALRCVEFNRENRPTITEVVEELNMIDLQPVPSPADGSDETTLAALSI